VRKRKKKRRKEKKRKGKGNGKGKKLGSENTINIFLTWCGENQENSEWLNQQNGMQSGYSSMALSAEVC
jgi:hypothetical protein